MRFLLLVPHQFCESEVRTLLHSYSSISHCALKPRLKNLSRRFALPRPLIDNGHKKKMWKKHFGPDFGVEVSFNDGITKELRNVATLDTAVVGVERESET